MDGGDRRSSGCFHEIVLTGEVVPEQTFGDTGPFGDAGQRRTVIAAIRQLLDG